MGQSAAKAARLRGGMKSSSTPSTHARLVDEYNRRRRVRFEQYRRRRGEHHTQNEHDAQDEPTSPDEHPGQDEHDDQDESTGQDAQHAQQDHDEHDEHDTQQHTHEQHDESEAMFHVAHIKRQVCSAKVCVVQPVTDPEFQTGFVVAGHDPTKSQAWYNEHAAQLVGEYKTDHISIGMVRGMVLNDAVFAAEYSCNFDNLDRIKQRVQSLVDLQNNQTSGATMVLAIITWQDAKPVLTMGVLGNNPIMAYEQAQPFAGVAHSEDYSRFSNPFCRSAKFEPDFFDKFHALNTAEARHALYTNERLNSAESAGDKYFNVSHTVTWARVVLPEHSTVVLANQAMKPPGRYWYSTQTQFDALTAVKQGYTTHDDFKQYYYFAKTCIVVPVDHLVPNQALVCGVFSAHNGYKVAKYMVDHLDACLTTDQALDEVVDEDYTNVRAKEVFTDTVHEKQFESCMVEIVPKEQYKLVLDQLMAGLTKARDLKQQFDTKISHSITCMKHDLPSNYVFLESHIVREVQRLKANVLSQDTQAYISIVNLMVTSLSNKLGLSSGVTEEDAFWDSIMVCRNVTTNEFRSIAFYSMDSKRLYVAYLVTHLDNIRGSSSRKSGASSEIMKFCLQLANQNNIAFVLKPIDNARDFYIQQGFVDTPYRQGFSSSGFMSYSQTPKQPNIQTPK
jgi:hypothetical protein